MDASLQVEPAVVTTVVRRDLQALIDIGIGAATSTASRSGALGRRLTRIAGPLVEPVVALALRPPLVSEAHQPVTWLTRLAQEGQDRRAELLRQAEHYLDVVVPLVVAAVIERLDVTALVERNVDLDEIINTLDLAGLTQTVMAEVDLPEIIRQSTGSLTSDTVLGVRMQSISADEAVDRAISRFRRRRRTKTQTATPPLDAPTTTPVTPVTPVP